MMWFLFLTLALAYHVKISIYNNNINVMKSLQCNEYYGKIINNFPQYIPINDYSVMNIDSKNISSGNCYFEIDNCTNLLEIIWLRNDILQWEFYGFNNDICWNGLVLYPSVGNGEFYFYKN